MEKLFKKLRFQLIVIVLLPALALLYFSSDYVYANYRNYQESLVLEQEVLYAKRVTDLVQALQRERGLSVACLQREEFCKLLPKYRQQSDGAIQAFYTFVSNSKSRTSKKLIQKLQELPLLRKRVDKKEIGLLQLLEVYNHYIQALMESIDILEQKVIDEDVFRASLSFVKVLELSEVNGQERALIAAILENSRPNEEILEYIKTLLVREEGIKKILFDNIPTDLLVLYRKVLPLDEERDFEALKKRIVFESNYFLLSKKVWWQKATAYIDKLFEIDREIATKLISLKDRFKEKTQKSLFISFIFWIVSLGALAIFFLMLHRFFRFYEKQIEQIAFENHLVRTVAEFSEDVLFIDNFNALIATYSALIGRIKTFAFHYIIHCDDDRIVAVEGVSAAYIQTHTPAKLQTFIEEVKKSGNGRVVRLYEERFKKSNDILLQPLAHDGCKFLLVAAIDSNERFDENVLDTINKLSEIFIFAYGQIELKIKEQKLKEELRLLSGAFDSHEAITITDANGKILRVNKAFERITGYKEEEVLGKTPAVLKSGKHGKEFYQKMWDAIKKEGYWKGEIYNKRKDGTIYPEILSITALRDKKGEIKNYIAHFFDISDIKEAQKEIERRANHDILTDLLNRRRLLEELNFIRATALREHFYNAFFFIDLDNFKYINDSYGHGIGDRVLIEVARLLERFQRQEDLVARIAGDEFAFVAVHLGKSEAEATKKASVLAEKLLDAFNRPLHIGELEIELGVSIGIAIFPTADRSAEEVITNADIAMYHSKKSGKNTFSFYNERLDIESKRFLLMKNEIKNGLEKGEFELYYQPKFRVDSLQLVGFEALLRWNSKTYGLLFPDRFLHYAYGNKLIYEISDFVIESVKEQLEKWSDHDVTISINLSAEQFNNKKYMHELLKRFDREWARRVILEIVEDAFVQEDMEYTLQMIKLYKERGVRFSIDDFGAGYTSLSYLRRLPVYEIKIDKSFVIDLFKDNNDKIVDMVVDIGHSFGFKVTAEGVESKEHLEFLQRIGCDFFQGFYMSRAVPAKDAERFFDSKR